MLGGVTFERIALGRAVEERAAAWYRSHGYEVVARNWRCPEGEVDVVAVRRHDRLVVFCEVKARRTARFGSAAEAVGRDKQARVRRLAAAWLAGHRGGAAGVRFDVAAWDGGRFEVVEGAF
ncbi:MAG: YraN family protein [Acidimicrobiales bacterium]